MISVIRECELVKDNPFTIAIIANPALEAPWNSGVFAADPIMQSSASFDSACQYIDASLSGNLPNQRERFIAEAGLLPFMRIVSIFDDSLDARDSNSLIAQDGVSNLLVPRRTVFGPFLAKYGLSVVDLAYAVSGSISHTRAAAWFTSDNDAGPGVPFVLDGVTKAHRLYNLIPGTIALHNTSSALTALHEFGHALSSYSNGTIQDLYVDGDIGVNNKHGRPIPNNYGDYNINRYVCDLTRGGIGYPADWASYHCELIDSSYPAVMDNYWQAADGVPERCIHDAITRQFLIDRILAKMSR
jgi:hypothetical protein